MSISLSIVLKPPSVTTVTDFLENVLKARDDYDALILNMTLSVVSEVVNEVVDAIMSGAPRSEIYVDHMLFDDPTTVDEFDLLVCTLAEELFELMNRYGLSAVNLVGLEIKPNYVTIWIGESDGYSKGAVEERLGGIVPNLCSGDFRELVSGLCSDWDSLLRSFKATRSRPQGPAHQRIPFAPGRHS